MDRPIPTAGSLIVPSRSKMRNAAAMLANARTRLSLRHQCLREVRVRAGPFTARVLLRHGDGRAAQGAVPRTAAAMSPRRVTSLPGHKLALAAHVPGACRSPTEISLRSLAPRDEPPEYRPVLEVIAGRIVGGIALHALADGLARRHVEAGDLALVAHEGGDLPVDGAAHIHDDLRLVGAPEPQLAHLVRLEALPRHVLGKVQVVARVGIHRVLGDDASLAMVAMLEAPGPEGIVDEHGVGPVAADGP